MFFFLIPVEKILRNELKIYIPFLCFKIIYYLEQTEAYKIKKYLKINQVWKD